MSAKTQKSKRLDYPNNTTGAKLARKVRLETNALTPAERKIFFEAGMRIVYGSAKI